MRNDNFLNCLWKLGLKWFDVVMVNREHATLRKHSIVDKNRFDGDGGIRRKGRLSPVDPLVGETGFIFGDSIDAIDAAVLVQAVWGQEIDRGICSGTMPLVVVSGEE